MTGGGLDRFDFKDAQRNVPYGEVNQSFQNSFLGHILGQPAQQGPRVPYEGFEKTHEHVNELNLTVNLGHYVISEIAQSQVSVAMLWPLVQVRPGMTTFKWTIESYRPGYADIVAEEAPSGLQRFSTEERSTTLDRRGLSVYMTVNTANTEEGLQRIRSQLQKVALSLLNTFEALIVQTLLTAHDGPRYLEKTSLEQFLHANGVADSVHGLIRHEASVYAQLNRDPEKYMGNDMAAANRVMKRYQVQPPYVLLYPEGAQNLIGARIMDRPGRIDVKTVGPDRQVLTMESMPSLYQTPDGGLAFPIREQSLGDRGAQIQPLLRGSMIAEHNMMTLDMGHKDVAHRTGRQLVGGGFSTDQRNVHIYHVGLDQYVEISFAEAFERSGLVDNEPDFGVHISAAEYPQESFEGEYRSAPPMYFFEGRIRRATRFGQLDANIVSSTLHRNVGETIAAMVQVSKGDPSKDIMKGMQLVEDLESAPYDPVFAAALEQNIFGPLMGGDAEANLVRLGEVRPDIFAPVEVGALRYLLPQDAQGGLVGTGGLGTADMLRAFDAAINASGTPPFMASLAGLNLLATLAMRNAATGKVLEMGKKAKRFLAAAKRIYGSLKSVFPRAIALDPFYRPLGIHLPNGFATFFSAMFLNNRSRPLVYAAGDVEVVTPFTVSDVQLDPLQRMGDDFPLRPMLDIAGQVGGDRFSTSIGRSVHFAEDDASAPAHKKTPWTVLSAMKQRTAAVAGSRARQRSGRAAAMQTDVDEADMFGAARATTTPIGAEIPAQFQTRGARRLRPRDPVREEEDDPMNAQNARNAWDVADRIEHPLVRVCTLTYLTASCNSMEDFRRMFAADILVPFNVQLIRPGITNEMYTMIVAKSGVDVMFHALTDVADLWGADTGQQTYLWTITVMHGVVLKNPHAVVILPNRLAANYLGGGGTRFFDNPGQLELDHAMRPDIIPMVVPFDYSPNPYEPMGGIDTHGLYGPVGSARFAGAYEYEKIWGLNRKAKETRAFANQYRTAASQVPGVTWTGDTLSYDRSLRQPAMGHRRDGSYPGCQAAWYKIGNALFPADKVPKITTV